MAIPTTAAILPTSTSAFTSAASVISSVSASATDGLSQFLAGFPKTFFSFAASALNHGNTRDSYEVVTPRNMSIAEGVSSFTQSVAATATATAPSAGTVKQHGMESFLVGGGAQRGVGNVLTYITSSWALLFVFMAILLNRTFIYASLRRPLRLSWIHRIFIRLPPIHLFTRHLIQLLLAIHNQTGPLAVFPAPLLHTITSPVYHLCNNFFGIPATSGAKLPGSVTLLWPLYRTLCYSHFIEVFACALTARSLSAETGMTLLEHSIAFAEAEAVADARFNNGRSLNTESEVLIMAALSAGSHLTSHVMGLFGVQSRWRLYSTGFWGILYLLAVGGWGVVGGNLGGFPTVCAVGFVPHLITIVGMLLCAGIYLLALLASSLNPPAENGRQRPSLSLGFNNLQANLTLQTVNLNASEDFYTSLLRIGFLCLTAASEATYLNEGRPIRVPGMTWLESERTRLLERENTWRENGFLKPNAASTVGNGYNKEKKELRDMQTGTAAKGKHPGSESEGFDLGRRNGRWLFAWDLIRGVAVVLARWTVVSAVLLWNRLRSRGQITSEKDGAAAEWIEDDDDEMSWLEVEGIDEEEVKLRFYQRFLTGQIFGEGDDSADYVPEEDDSSYESEEEEDIDDDATPTPESWALRRRERSARSPTPEASLSELYPTAHELASLISPTTASQRADARLLASHLRSDAVVTRSQYRPGQDFEHILISRRQLTATPANPSSSSDGAVVADKGQKGWENGMPMCVVCQSSPRTILVWPCRCLALCEECRVCLALNNYGCCSCCRREVSGFSRIWVP